MKIKLNKIDIAFAAMMTIALLIVTSLFAAEVEEKPYVDGQVLIKIVSPYEFALPDLDALAAKYGMKMVRQVFMVTEEDAEMLAQKFTARAKRAPKYSNMDLRGSTFLFKIRDGQDPETFCKSLNIEESIAFCQPNYILKTNSVYEPNDPLFNSYGSWGQNDWDQWDLRAIKVVNEDTGESVWDLTQGEGITVAVIDSGLDIDHPDIANNVWTNQEEIPSNGIDDDGNGYVDDVHGWDFSANSGKMNDSVYGHGTWVAGIIAAEGDNSEGVVGVAPKAKIMPLKVTYDLYSLAPTEQIVKAIKYAVYNGADIINISMSSSYDSPSNPVLEEAIQFAHSLGVVVVVAAGNNGMDTAKFSPANIPEVITVSATNEYDQMVLFNESGMFTSNYGDFVDVAAPGIDILTTDAVNSMDMIAMVFGSPDKFVGSEYYRAQGTSMSAAIVSGAAALMLANNAEITNDDVKQILRVTAEDIGDAGFDKYFGYGRIDVARAVSLDGVPGAKITSPADKGVVNIWDEYIPIDGVASGYNFKNYQLLYRSSDEPDNWINIEGPVNAPVEGGDLQLTDWYVGNLSTGTYLLKLIVTTTTGFEFEDVIQVELADLNNAPVFESMGSFTVTAGDELSFNVSASDADGDNIVYSAAGLPDGATFDASTAEFRWTPTNDQSGIYSVQFYASDGKADPVLSDAIGISVEKAGNAPKIRFLYNHKNRVIFYSAYDVEDMYRVQYSYRIDGGEWFKLGRRMFFSIARLKNMHKLSSGTHTFEIKAIDSEGFESEIKSVSFDIKYKKAKKYKHKKHKTYKTHQTHKKNKR